MSVVNLVKKSTTLGVILAAICVLFGSAHITRAAGEIGRYFKPPASASTCDTMFMFVDIPFFHNVPNDGQTWEFVEDQFVTDGTNMGSRNGRYPLNPTSGEELGGRITAISYPPTSPGAITLPLTFTMTLTTLANGVAVHTSEIVIGCDAGGNASILSLTNTLLGANQPSTKPSAAIPGPDMVSIPDDAVVGTFTTPTALHFQPVVGAATPHMMSAGQSLWVFGLDASGAFYQVLLSGKTYWVPMSTIGPTYSPPWNSAPLPGGIVQ